MVAALREVAAGGVKIVPDIQVGSDGGGVLGGLGALLMRSLSEGSAPDDMGSDEDDPADAVVEIDVAELAMDDAGLPTPVTPPPFDGDVAPEVTP